MAGQHGILLATLLIKEHFGEIVSKVCDCLLRRGSLQFRDIVRYTALKHPQVRNCLLVLVQHNCVQAFSLPSSRDDSQETLYMAIFDNIIHRIRFTKFLGVVIADLGPQCGLILEGLLQHGRLTFEQLLEFAKSKTENDATRDALLVNFNKLVLAHYVERCPKPEPFILPQTEEDARPKRRGAKFVLETATFEKEALEAATLANAERFMEIMDTLDGAESTCKRELPLTGEKRKHGDLDVDGGTQFPGMENEILWRANSEKFLHCLKRKRCVAHKRSLLGLEAAMVLEALLESSDCSQDTVSSSVDNIFERLGGKLQGRIKDMQHVRAVLDELGCLLRSEERTSIYSIDLREIIKDCQVEEVQALILERYGQSANRIFRLLVKDGKPIETSKISDYTLVDKKQVLGLLSILWKNGFLHMEKMSGATQKPYLLWKVNRDAVWEHVLEDVYHATYNLNQRIILEHEKNKEILNIEGKNEVQRQLRNQCLKKIWLLETALLELDESLLLFHDFIEPKDDIALD